MSGWVGGWVGAYLENAVIVAALWLTVNDAELQP